MSDVSEDIDTKYNKHLLIASIFVGLVIFGIMGVIFYFTFIVLDEYKFDIYTFFINIFFTGILGTLSGIYMWLRILKRDNKSISIIFFIMAVIFIVSKLLIETHTGISSGVITPYNGIVIALGTIGNLIAIDILLFKAIPQYVKRRKSK